MNQTENRKRLLVVLAIVATTVGGVAALDTARAATTEGGVQGELDGGLRLDTHHERGNVHNLAAHTDVTLADQHTGVVDGLGQATLEHEGLEATLHEVLEGERQHVIETLLVLIEDSVADHAAHEGLTLEDTLWVLLVLGQQGTSSGTDLGEGETHTPDPLLVLKTILADQLELSIKTLLLEVTELGASHIPRGQKLEYTAPH